MLSCGGVGDEQTSCHPVGGCGMSRRHAVPDEQTSRRLVGGCGMSRHHAIPWEIVRWADVTPSECHPRTYGWPSKDGLLGSILLFRPVSSGWNAGPRLVRQAPLLPEPSPLTLRLKIIKIVLIIKRLFVLFCLNFRATWWIGMSNDKFGITFLEKKCIR